MLSGARLVRHPLQRLFAGAAAVIEPCGREARRCCSLRPGAAHSARLCSSPPASMCGRCSRAIRATHGIKALAHNYRRRLSRQHPAHPARSLSRPNSTWKRSTYQRSSPGSSKRAASRNAEMLAYIQTAASAMVVVVDAGQAAQVAARAARRPARLSRRFGRVLPRRDAGASTGDISTYDHQEKPRGGPSSPGEDPTWPP